MKKFVSALSCVALFAGLSSAAANASVFTFSFTGPTDSGSGTLTGNAVSGSPGEFLITGITGTTDGSTIMGMIPVNGYPNIPPFASNDNLLINPSAITGLNTAPGFLDINGLSYMLANGTDVNLYYGIYLAGDPEIYNFYYGANGTNDALTSFTVLPNLAPVPSATPEPESLVLLGTGVLSLVGVMRRRFAVA